LIPAAAAAAHAHEKHATRTQAATFREQGKNTGRVVGLFTAHKILFRKHVGRKVKYAIISHKSRADHGAQ
jgi:CBS domain-containing protein